jgi:hypothetical protein
MGYEGGCEDQNMFLVFNGAREMHKATKATPGGFSGDFFSLTQNELSGYPGYPVPVPYKFLI